MSITGDNNYFEDFVVGDRYIHPRGKTVTEMDNVLFTNLSMNTAAGHFDEHMMSKVRVGNFGMQRVVVGSFTISLVMGLTSEDLSENALADVGLDKLRLRTPVFHGDTLYAESEVLEKRETDLFPGAGIVRFGVTGKNQRGDVVFEGERLVALKKKAHYLDEDQRFGV